MRITATIAFVVATAGAAWAGPTAHVGKELTKGVTTEIKNEVGGVNAEKSARDVSNGVIEGFQGHGKDIDRSARDLGRSLAQGFFIEVRDQLGSDGKGPLATSMSAAGATGSAQAAHGFMEEVSHWLPECRGQDRGACMDALVSRYAYDSAKAAARGAAETASLWTTVLIAAAGFAAGLLVSAVIALLLGQRRLQRHMRSLRPTPSALPV